ncbi:MAG: hypothetical protein ACOWWR_18395 [Eubacteriales bacterium]
MLTKEEYRGHRKRLKKEIAMVARSKIISYKFKHTYILGLLNAMLFTATITENKYQRYIDFINNVYF